MFIQLLRIPVKPERVEKMFRSGVIQERANVPPRVILNPLRENAVQLNVVAAKSNQVQRQPIAESAAPQIDDSSSTSSDDNVDIDAQLANIRQTNGVEVASHAPPLRVLPRVE